VLLLIHDLVFDALKSELDVPALQEERREGGAIAVKGTKEVLHLSHCSKLYKNIQSIGKHRPRQLQTKSENGRKRRIKKKCYFHRYAKRKGKKREGDAEQSKAYPWP